MSRPIAAADAGDLDLDRVRECVKDLLARDAEAAFLRRASRRQYEAAREAAPDAVHHPRSGLVVLTRPRPRPCSWVPRPVAVVSAGTADLPVAEEARAAASALGLPATLTADVGVAGLHRLLAVREELDRARLLIVVAGMDGALPSAVARLSSRPVVAVPTSVGYGSSDGGLAALAALLTSGAPGLAATGIDDGLGAAVLAWRLLA
ncbi:MULTISPECIES: nickel pincer cofactor biosynthesis protein LarB [unclassified Actinomadura]|uniref:nickel pincer cofactor biosynthesis protein LarB n=1 Tax=unclassified Actinomadura TaxID=2626254 RepID=UPI0010486AC8|nr:MULTISPECIES: nickel pincer cofactor biosynthesis protein LarB [unclassified Actinomadura]TDB93519.1 nickel pincer cofactor biosynthesis protein LarB [Actinomadura sp. 7K534]